MIRLKKTQIVHDHRIVNRAYSLLGQARSIRGNREHAAHIKDVTIVENRKEQTKYATVMATCVNEKKKSYQNRHTHMNQSSGINTSSNVLAYTYELKFCHTHMDQSSGIHI